MASMSRTMILGNVGRDPEIKKTPSDTSVANFSVATTESFVDKAGEKKNKTEWHNVVAWGKLAELVGKYVKKGSQIYVEGHNETRSWEKDGMKQYRTEIIASSVVFCGGGDRRQDTLEPRQQESRQAPTESFGGDDDLPF